MRFANKVGQCVARLEELLRVRVCRLFRVVTTDFIAVCAICLHNDDDDDDDDDDRTDVLTSI